MQDIIIQVISTLISAFIIYLVGYIKNLLTKLIANKTFKYILFVLFIYIVEITNNVIILKLIINTPFDIILYMIGISSLAIGFYSLFNIMNTLKLLFNSFTINNKLDKDKN